MAKNHEVIRALINVGGLNSTDVAKASELTPSTVSRYLNGKTDIKSENLAKLLASLGVDLSLILRRKIISRLNGLKSDSTIDDDLSLALHSLCEVDQKTILNTIVASMPPTADFETKQAGQRLIQKARSLAIRKRRQI